MKREPDYNPDNKMVVSNQYIRAVHPERMNINAMKLFRLVITQCRMKDEEFYEYSCRITDLSALFETDPKDLYRDVQKLCKNLVQTVLYLGDGNPKHNWEYRAIFSKCKYEAGKGIITIKLSPDVTDLFLRLKRDFTQMPIENILLMRSKHSIRLYELLCEKMKGAYPYAGNATAVDLSLDEVRTITGTDKKASYNRIGNFKDRVLLPALKGIEEAADWKIVLSNIKDQRKVVGFHLEIWSRNGWEIMEECKRTGKLPPQPKYMEVPGQLSLFDDM